MRPFSPQDSRAVYDLAKRPTALGARVKDAMCIIDEAVGKYGLSKLALSFNGGKDCTVLVHLLAASVLRSVDATLSPSSVLPPIKCVYVQCTSPFPQVESFVQVCTPRYHLDLQAIEGNMRDALEQYLERSKADKEGGVEAILVGTRRGDPHGALLTPFTRTDSGWPDFMRVHPILDWTYGEIWDFLREPSLSLGDGTIEYCELYDVGYTSLGSTFDTFPNPLLRAKDDSSVIGGWKPAWELLDASQERAGRGKKVSTTETEVKEVGTPPVTILHP